MGVSDGTVVGISKIVNHGEDGVNWNLVITGDGFTAGSQLSDFRDYVDDFVATLQATAPFDRFWDDINVHRLEVESDETGADNPATCDDGTAPFIGATSARTYFDATYCTADPAVSGSGIRRLLTVNETVVYDQTLNEPTSAGYFPEYDAVVVIVNHVEQGGSGGEPAVYSVTAGHQAGIHELGHSAFGLADEYDYFEGCDVTEPDQYVYDPADGEPAEPNVTIDASQTNLKWGSMVDPATAVPTTTNPDPTQCHVPDPATLPPAGTIGFFDGARYFHHGVYRPAFACMMRDKTSDFCDVCQLAIQTGFYTASPFALPCFIATAVYNDPRHPDVETLRRWRDRRLRRDARGRRAMALASRAYGQLGPILADVTRTRPRLARTLRRVIFAPAAAALNRRERRTRR